MSTDANSTSLESDETLHSLELGAYALAICILVVLSCLERGLKGKRPGIVVPVDLLGGDKLTYAYAAAFGCTSSTILRLILTENTVSINVSPELRHWVQIPLWLLLSTVVSLKFYPIFAAISYKIESVGIITGLIYCTYLLKIEEALLPMYQYLYVMQPVTQLVSYSYEKTYVEWLFKSNSENTLVGIGNVQEASVGAYQ
ncbi:stimulated by retinoic acid gene 6 protein-like [Mytilus trossulus]|uniref:stimulated by retinoic acid gene 6 protein-like n=1 Tax=Mytilus trossulus TaxID=6551 RepID=UPI0030060C61